MELNYNPFSLQGKIILVTGASSGIGRATAIECAKMGASVIGVARNQERLEETLSLMLPNDAVPHQMISADLIQNGSIDKIVDALPSIDGAALCAGKALTLPVQFSSREMMDPVFEINFFSNAELMRMIYKKKKIKKEGSIVLIDSIGGVTGFSPGNAIYGASKAALCSFAKFAAIEFAPRKVRVNCILPGMTETPLIHSNTITQTQLDEYKDRIPLKRFGYPEDIAYGVIYLLSDASKWVTGIDLVIDGGSTI